MPTTCNLVSSVSSHGLIEADIPLWHYVVFLSFVGRIMLLFLVLVLSTLSIGYKLVLVWSLVSQLSIVTFCVSASVYHLTVNVSTPQHPS